MGPSGARAYKYIGLITTRRSGKEPAFLPSLLSGRNIDRTEKSDGNRASLIYHKKSMSCMPYIYNYGILTKCEVKMAGYWPTSFFACIWAETEARSINLQKQNEANIQPS